MAFFIMNSHFLGKATISPSSFLKSPQNGSRVRPIGPLPHHDLRYTARHRAISGTHHSVQHASRLTPQTDIEFQSFVMTKVCFNALPMSSFTTLQKRVFPIYFKLQSLLLLCTALTHPPLGPLSLVRSRTDLALLGFSGAMAALNLTVYGPRMEKTMMERIHQGIYLFGLAMKA